MWKKIWTALMGLIGRPEPIVPLQIRFCFYDMVEGDILFGGVPNYLLVLSKYHFLRLQVPESYHYLPVSHLVSDLDNKLRKLDYILLTTLEDDGRTIHIYPTTWLPEENRLSFDSIITLLNEIEYPPVGCLTLPCPMRKLHPENIVEGILL